MIRFLKSLLEGQEQIFESNLFHSMMMYRKNFFKKAVIGFSGMLVFGVTSRTCS